MSALIEVRDLYKTYRVPGRHAAPWCALDGLTFEVSAGAIYAFVGPNGAGKTTTIRILATLLAFDAGEVRVCGHRVDASPREVRRCLGYIPDEFGLYGDMLVHEYLTFFAGCYDLPPRQRPGLVDDLLSLVGLSDRRENVVRGLSRGMRQRLGLARALIHDPMIIVADEPAAGLDPRARVELREIFVALQEMGKTVFISSHVLRELDDIASHVGIIVEGRLVASGTLDAVRAQLRPHRRVRLRLLTEADTASSLKGTVGDAHAWLSRRTDVLDVQLVESGDDAAMPGTFLVSVPGDQQALAVLLRDMVHAGFLVVSYAEERETLERVFLDLT